MDRKDFIHHELHVITHGDYLMRPYCPCGWVGVSSHAATQVMKDYKNHVQ